MEILILFYKYWIGWISEKFWVSEDEGKIFFILAGVALIIVWLSFYSMANPIGSSGSKDLPDMYQSQSQQLGTPNLDKIMNP